MKLLTKIKANKTTLTLMIFIMSMAFFLRTYNLNWDQNHYFHPDERAIVMFTDNLKMPSSFKEFLSPESTLNPNFFAYGNFPLYLLKIIGEISASFNPILNSYGGLHLVGRVISAAFDTATVLIIFLIGNKLFSRNGGLISAFIYAVSVFPIQLSHFFAVDTLLTFFLLLSLFIIFLFYEKTSYLNSIFLGLSFGFALATKISALIFAPIILFVFVLIYILKKTKLIKLIYCFILTAVSAIFIFTITQPYVLIDFSDFINQTKQQTQMSNNPFVFPYTLQYVGKMPYIYELKNIFLWGFGPIASFFALVGFIGIISKFFKSKNKNYMTLILISYFLIYFVLFGRFAVGWMRYMLPIYPVLAIFAGYFILGLFSKTDNRNPKLLSIRNLLISILFLFLFIYPLSFLSIYQKQNPRIEASNWINKNIPPGSTLAIEHWDDALPVYGGQKYIQVTLPLYDNESEYKWEEIYKTLDKSDYIILASNRLYTPLQKLTDCKNLPEGKCYNLTADYYKSLFNGSLGFEKVIEFTNYPTIPIFQYQIVDDPADESFTVYDHPKVIIFRKR